MSGKGLINWQLFIIDSETMEPTDVDQSSVLQRSQWSCLGRKIQVIFGDSLGFWYIALHIYSALRCFFFPSLEWLQIIKSVLWNFAIIQVLPSALNNPKDLDLCYKTDLDFWDCFGRKNSSYNQRNTIQQSMPNEVVGILTWRFCFPHWAYWKWCHVKICDKSRC